MQSAPRREPGHGLLVTFEGGEGSGKSTQIERLADFLRDEGHEVVTAREPGTTQVGEAVRELLLRTAGEDLSAEAELALFLAARAELVAEVVGPALGAGRVVLLDRYGDSSVAYQGYGRGLDPARVKALNAFFTRGTTPDLTFLIDVPVEAFAERSGERRADRIERAGRAFHDRVRRAYREMALNEPERFVVLDGTEPIDSVQSAIRGAVLEALAERVPTPRAETS
ncbi:MAG TPA: dTMP kinase [Gemmatimonadota bacterium]|nr:dTMP kinase [Gemmatimonadota bacterium]